MVFLLKSGKRQWILQASSSRDFSMWMSQIRAILKQVGAIEKPKEEEKQSIGSQLASSLKIGSSVDISSSSGGGVNAHIVTEEQKLEQQSKEVRSVNYQLKQQVEALRNQVVNMEKEMAIIKDETVALQQNEETMKKDIRRRYEDRMVAEQQKWEQEHERIRQELEQLHLQLEDKASKEGWLQSTLFEGFQEDTGNHVIDFDKDDDENEIVDEEKKKQIELQKKQALQNMKHEGGDGTEHVSAKVTHKHIHRHDHKHVCHHKHLHLHDHSNKDNYIVYVQTHTVAHTVVHTSTQLKIQKKLF